MPIITLLTDFGTQDAYVAAMKGVILGMYPQAHLVDITHQVPAQDVRQAAFLLASVHRFFPSGTIHLAVVDPGVGTQRRAIALGTPSATYLAPDNGLLSYVLDDLLRPQGSLEPVDWAVLRQRPLRPPLTAVSLTTPDYWLKPVSHTFHGRDIFAPVAAHLSLGVPLALLGEPVSWLNAFYIPHPIPQPDSSLRCHIVHVDAFGNLVTDARVEDLPSPEMTIEVGGRRIQGLSHSYAEGGELLALIGSAGYLEVAARNASAARLLGLKVGDVLLVRQG